MHSFSFQTNHDWSVHRTYDFLRVCVLRSNFPCVFESMCKNQIWTWCILMPWVLSKLSAATIVSKKKRPTAEVGLARHHLYSAQQEIFISEKFCHKRPSAVRQEFIYVERRLSLVCSKVVRLSLFCWLFIFTFMNISDPTLAVLWKFHQELNIAKNLLWRKRQN